MIKSTKTLKSIAVLLIIPASIFLINLLFFSGNKDAEKYVDDYINNSISIELDMSNDKISDAYFKIDRVYTGIRTAFLRGKLTGKRVEKMVFYSIDYHKYFSLSIISEKPMQFDAYYTFAVEKVIAKVNNYELEISNYGTRDNPIHIFMLTIPDAKNTDFLEKVITEDQYRRTVLFYLSYIMPKKEFKKLFKNSVSINNKRK